MQTSKMPVDQIIIGMITAGTCGIGLLRRDWLLTQTLKGRHLVERCGQAKATRIVTVVLAVGVLAGVLLACNILRPMRW